MRNYDSISPSAKGLLLMKALTDIPFIADVAKIVWGKGDISLLKDKLADITFLKRLIHFEARYKSVDEMLLALGGKNVVEISSGFSFRGLHSTVNDADVTYIDTDLPGVIEVKNSLVNELIDKQSLNLQGDLLVMPLNALDEDSFTAAVAKLPPGPVNIINEGLLMYLNTDEKARLCSIIRNLLLQRGGYWITADIYIKKDVQIPANDQFSQFLEAHNVEQNKFDSFEQAEGFFAAQGFKIHQKGGRLQQPLSSFKYLPQHAITELQQQAGKIGRIRETWALVPI